MQYKIYKPHDYKKRIVSKGIKIPTGGLTNRLGRYASLKFGVERN